MIALSVDPAASSTKYAIAFNGAWVLHASHKSGKLAGLWTPPNERVSDPSALLVSTDHLEEHVPV